MARREEIDTKYKWNLAEIYPSWDDWDKDVEVLKSLLQELVTFKGRINDIDTFAEFKRKNQKLERLLEKLYLYPYLMKDLDSTDEVVSVKMQQIEGIYMNIGVEMSWVEPEILEIPIETINKWFEDAESKEEFKIITEYKFPILEAFRQKKHVLSKDKEKLLSYFGQYFSIPSDIYNELAISDMKFNKITLENGEEVEITNGAFSKIMSTCRNRDDRRKAFEAMYKAFEINKNTYATIYRTILTRNSAMAKARNYNSSLEQALEPKNIDSKVFLSLIESAKENTAPLRRYFNLRKEYMGLDSYHIYDNYIDLVSSNSSYKYEDAKEIVCESVKPLGEEYHKKIVRAVSEGWLDVFETNNKRSGAYSCNIFDVHPYMLLNYQETLNDVFTLAHELGHTLHSMLSSENQPYATHDYTIFVAEVASTFNERLLLTHMLNKISDPNEKIAMLEQALGNFVSTFYRQALFAAYEYEAHLAIESGKAITADILSGIMSNLYDEFYGDAMANDDLEKLVWARIPHLYNSPFYVYQYATSFAASLKLYSNVCEGKDGAVEKYLDLLKSGGNNHPIEQLKLAGVDLSLKETFDVIGEEFNKLLDIFEGELKKLK